MLSPNTCNQYCVIRANKQIIRSSFDRNIKRNTSEDRYGDECVDVGDVTTHSIIHTYIHTYS